ncbi:MAG: hypothetical protein JNL11_08925 [Bdellovibrionaceae bacterium]|nr:hypothetical protein [Pseudobdellovibrionaceae bacterium]
MEDKAKKPKTSKSNYKNKRVAPRKEVEPLRVTFMASLNNLAKIAKNCQIVEASASGLLLTVLRDDLIPASLRGNLNLDCLVGDRVYLKVEPMNIEISGEIRRTKFLGKQGFHIAVDYSEDAPEYWRECLMDFLPKPGEFDQETQ